MANRNLRIIALIVFILFSISQVPSLGVNSPYWEANPLKMYPGQTKEISFSLVTRPDVESERAYVTLEEGQRIAEIISGSEYTVVPGSLDSKVVLRINIPENAQLGYVYNIRFSVKALPQEEGPVQLTVKYNIDFPIQVVPESEVPKDQIPEKQKTPSSTLPIIIGVIILLAIILSITLKKNFQKKK